MPALSTVASGRRQKSLSEDQIHRAVVQHLKARARKGTVYFHPANGGQRNKTEAARFVGLGVKAGVPDLIILSRGKTFGLELKVEKGRVTPIQKSVHEEMRAAGATVEVAFGLDDALAQLVEWGIIHADAR